jgi:hypothetical protein
MVILSGERRGEVVANHVVPNEECVGPAKVTAHQRVAQASPEQLQ